MPKHAGAKLNIVIVVSYAYPYIGSGVGDVARAQAEKLALRGHSVTVISGNFPNSQKVFYYNKVRYIKEKAWTFLEKLNVPVPVFWFGKDSLKSFKEADIIHIHDVMYPSSLLALILAKMNKKPILTTVHILHIKYQNPIVNLSEKLVMLTFGQMILKGVNKVIVINKSFMETDALKRYLNKITFLQNGIETDIFKIVDSSEKVKLRRKYGLPKDKFIYLFVGRFVPKKGYDLLLNSVSRNYLLLMIGGTPYRKTKSNFLIVKGKIEKSKLADYYKLSDGFVLPSYGEGFPLSVQEAALSGLPLFLGKNNEYIKSFDKRFVKLLKYNSGSIKKILEQSLKPETLAKMRKYSLSFAKTNLIDWDKNVTRLEQIYYETSNYANIN